MKSLARAGPRRCHTDSGLTNRGAVVAGLSDSVRGGSSPPVRTRIVAVFKVQPHQGFEIAPAARLAGRLGVAGRRRRGAVSSADGVVDLDADLVA